MTILTPTKVIIFYTCGRKADRYKCESGMYLPGGVEQVVEHSGDLLGVKSNGGELLADRSLE